jgi:hypothetical protein
MGNVALRRVCDITGIEAHHGYVHETPYGLAVPTFHPAYLIRGTSEVEGQKSRNLRYFPVVVFALQRALEVASGRFQKQPVEYLLDPRLEDAKAYVERCRERQLADTSGIYSFSCSNVVSSEHSSGGAHVAPTLKTGEGAARGDGAHSEGGNSDVSIPPFVASPGERHLLVPTVAGLSMRIDPTMPTVGKIIGISSRSSQKAAALSATACGPDAATREGAGASTFLSLSPSGPNPSGGAALQAPALESGGAGEGNLCQGLPPARIPLLFLDLETPESSAFEGQEEEPPQFAGRRLKLAGPIIRCSFSLWPGTAVSFPWQEPFISWAKEVIQRADTIAAWNGYDADFPKLGAEGVLGAGIRGRLSTAGVQPVLLDPMWAWHFLQSDLPKALGFVAPFFYDGPAWKHQSASDPAYYNAVDSDAGLRALIGTKQALERQGRWARFMRHCTQTQPIFERMGFIQVDREQQSAFQARLKLEYDVAHATLQTKAPESIKPVKVWKRPPKDMAGVRAVKVPTGEHQGLLELEVPDENT